VAGELSGDKACQDILKGGTPGLAGVLRVDQHTTLVVTTSGIRV